MEFTTHNDINIDVTGTHLQGYIQADYEKLVKRFGKPLEGDYKTDWEWELQFENGSIATIYNWKNGPNYCGETGLHHDQIFEWHVGGFDQRALEQVVYALLGEIKCFT